MWMSFTTNNTFFVFGAVWCLVSETVALKTLKDPGCCLKLLDPKIYACFPAYEISASACLGSSLFILINGRSLPVLLDFILSASAWLILLKSSSSLESLIVMLIDTPLNTKNLLFKASAEWFDFGSDTLTFGPKTCFILVSLCRWAKSLGVSPMKIQPFVTAWFEKLWG